MTLSPLRWRMTEPVVLVDDVIHRRTCKLQLTGRDLPTGTILERVAAPTRCGRCCPDYDLLLGPVDA